MSEAERHLYANSKTCDECGLPIAACNKIAMQRLRIEALEKALREIERFEPRIIVTVPSGVDPVRTPHVIAREALRANAPYLLTNHRSRQ